MILNEYNISYRQIYTDGRPLPVSPKPSWDGYSSGKWEGDTLVVETIGFRDGNWLDAFGDPITDSAKVTERFRRIDYGHLEIEVTIDDPKAYTQPWTVKLNQVIVPDEDLLGVQLKVRVSFASGQEFLRRDWTNPSRLYK